MAACRQDVRRGVRARALTRRGGPASSGAPQSRLLVRKLILSLTHSRPRDAGAVSAWVDADESGDFALTFDIGCSGDASAFWSLVIDTPSAEPAQPSDNDWGANLLPGRFVSNGRDVGQVIPAQVRTRLVGYDASMDLPGEVATAWEAFRADNPAWVSPRCRGVVDPGDACGCVDDRSEPDTDEDTILDACDICEGQDDLTAESPAACTSGRTYPNIDLVRGNASFAYDPVLDLLPVFAFELFGGPPERPYMTLTLVAQGREACFVTRTAMEDVPASALADTTATSLLTWRLDSENSTLTTNCDGILDPRVWGLGIGAAVNATEWSASLVDTCAAEECPFADAPLWAEFAEFGNASAECDVFTDACLQSALGLIVGFSADTVAEAADGMPSGYASMLPANEEFSYVGDGFDWLPATEVRLALPRMIAFGAFSLSGGDEADLATMFGMP